jgi:hypothetical protein
VRFKREYFVWASMKQRCFNAKDRAFPLYGARGITVCERWITSFEAFLEDMGPCPLGLTLDRANNNGNYEPDNCRWVSQSRQNRNSRRTRQITFNGRTQALSDWAEEVGIPRDVIYDRLAKGWTAERALTTVKRMRLGK